jgi:hypothetical protein
VAASPRQYSTTKDATEAAHRQLKKKHNAASRCVLQFHSSKSLVRWRVAQMHFQSAEGSFYWLTESRRRESRRQYVIEGMKKSVGQALLPSYLPVACFTDFSSRRAGLGLSPMVAIPSVAQRNPINAKSAAIPRAIISFPSFLRIQ